MGRIVWIVVVAAICAVLAACNNSVPQNTDALISYKYATSCTTTGNDMDPAYGYQIYLSNSCSSLIRNDDTAYSYYMGLGISDPGNYNFAMWLSDHGFPPDGSSNVSATYANLADLQIGRDMHCSQSGQKIACFVSNYGQAPMQWTWDKSFTTWSLFVNTSWPDITYSVEAPFVHSPFGRVAMVYDPTITGPNQVSFYAFGPKFSFDSDGDPIPCCVNGDPTPVNDSLLYEVALDQEGPKTVPRMCMACHGGTYDPGSNSATGSSFLPFDVFAFRYPVSHPGYGFDDQQESMRQLNALVTTTDPNQPILDLLNGMYANGVGTAGTVPSDGWVPPGWSGNPVLYTSVIRPYCRMCHMAQAAIALDDYPTFQGLANAVNDMVCTKHDMPHSEVAYGVSNTKVGFWNDRVAQQDLGTFLKSQGVNSCLPSD